MPLLVEGAECHVQTAATAAEIMHDRARILRRQRQEYAPLAPAARHAVDMLMAIAEHMAEFVQQHALLDELAGIEGRIDRQLAVFPGIMWKKGTRDEQAAGVAKLDDKVDIAGHRRRVLVRYMDEIEATFGRDRLPLARRLLRNAAVLGRMVLGGATQVAFVSETVKRHFERSVRFRAPPVLVVNGVDTEVFRPAVRAPDPPMRPQRPEPRPDPPRLPESVQTDVVDTRAVDNDIVSDEPSDDPVTPAGPSTESFVDARADARYGDDNRVRYPRTALRNREQGEVQLRVLIARDGRAIRVELARSSGSRDLDREAQRAVLKWRFVAAERNGEKIESWAVVPIRFDLQNI